jgi:hypothetical protein
MWSGMKRGGRDGGGSGSDTAGVGGGGNGNLSDVGFRPKGAGSQEENFALSNPFESYTSPNGPPPVAFEGQEAALDDWAPPVDKWVPEQEVEADEEDDASRLMRISREKTMAAVGAAADEVRGGS